MGGFTSLQLRNISQENIDEQNQNLNELGVAKRYRFYSERDVREEYDYYLKGDGIYPEHMFPSEKINSFEDFKKYWSPEALGEVFVPRNGMLTFDCYFGRTSKRAMHGIAQWVLIYGDSQLKETSGSYSTFVERSEYKTKKILRTLMQHE